MTTVKDAGNQGKVAGSLRVPEGAEWFAVEKLLKVTDKESGKLVEKYKTQFGAHADEPGVKVSQFPIPEGGLDDAKLRQEIAAAWGYGFYRLRWSKGGRSTPFQIVDPEKTEAASEAFGGKLPKVARTVEETGQASPIGAIELMPAEFQKGFAMMSFLKQFTAADVAAQQEQQRQHFTLMLEMVKEARQQPGTGGGLDARDLKIALLETVAPLREEIAAMKLENARLRREIAEVDTEEEEEEIDWEKPIGEILGIEVKKAVVELASELTPEALPLLKVAVPTFLRNLKAEMVKAHVAKNGAAS